MIKRRLSITGCAAVLAAGLFGEAPAGAAQDGMRMYAAVAQSDDGGTVVTTREILGIGSEDGKPFVRISNGASTASFAANVASDGEISTDSQDGGLICYNMAAAIATAYEKDPTQAIPLYVRFLDKIVALPLSLQAQSDGSETRTLAFDGQDTGTISNGQTTLPSGLFVEGKVVERRGSVESAVFDESTMAGSPGRRVGGTHCAVMEVQQSIGT